MDKELKILELADYYERFTVNGSSACLIINERMADYKCLFGFVTLTDSFSDAKELFERMEKRAAEKGYSHIAGPVNYCSWMSYRWAVSRYDMKLYPDCTNPPYYNDFIKKLGYSELYTYRSALIDLNNPLYLMGERVYKEKLEEGFEFKLFEGKEAYTLAKDIFEISRDAFEGSFLYCDIPFEYFEQLYLGWTTAVNIIMYTAYKDDKPVGYVMGYTSPYGDYFISKTSAVKKAFRKNKLYTALLYLGCEHVKRMGYNSMMYHFQCEQKETFKRFDNEIESDEKRYAVYAKELGK